MIEVNQPIHHAAKTKYESTKGRSKRKKSGRGTNPAERGCAGIACMGRWVVEECEAIIRT